jgi:hypothetical protein
MLAFLQFIARFFNQRQIPYMLSGSVAMSVYTLPRATRDFDFIVYLRAGDVDALTSYFSEGYYCDRDAIIEALHYKTMFNIIDYASGFKADFVILKDTVYREMEFSRRIKVDFEGMPIYIVTAEDLLLSKLIWIQDLQSVIQIEDIKQLAALATVDWNYIREWIQKLNLNTFELLKDYE